MPEFKYKAIDVKGVVSEGELVAPTQQSLAAMLEARGLFLMEYKDMTPAEQAVHAAAPKLDALTPAPLSAKDTELVARPDNRVSLRTVAVFTSQWAVMMHSAIPIIEALDMLAKQESDSIFKAILAEIGRSVRQGQALSKSFARYPKIFDEVYISLLASGEASGKLDIMLERLASHLNFQIQLREKVRSALIYPTIVILTATMVVAFLIIFVLPTFMEVFTQFDITLPLPTRMLIFLSEQIRHWWYIVVLGIGGIWWYLSRLVSDPAHTRAIHDLQIKLPIVGPLVRNIVMTRILRTLGALTESGIPILKSLALSKAAAGNIIFGELIDEVVANVKEGRGISLALSNSPYIPASVVGMISTGEKTGTLPEVVNTVAGFYEAELDTSIKNMFSAMEPLFIVGLGFLVGGIAISVLLPMFDLAGGIR